MPISTQLQTKPLVLKRFSLYSCVQKAVSKWWKVCVSRQMSLSHPVLWPSVRGQEKTLLISASPVSESWTLGQHGAIHLILFFFYIYKQICCNMLYVCSDFFILNKLKQTKSECVYVAFKYYNKHSIQ